MKSTLRIAAMGLALILGLGLPVASFTIATTAYAAEQQSVESYNAGWKAGWAGGWKKVKGEHSFPPFPPFPPFPGFNKATYRHGYEDGFLAGIAEAMR